MQRTGLRRAIAAIVLALSTTVTALLPVADARADVASGRARAHVEQPGSTRCPQVHDELTCQLCRVLRLASNATSSAAPLVVVDAGAIPFAAHVVLLPATRVEPSASPRAPPSPAV